MKCFPKKRTYTPTPDDFILYQTHCSCGEIISGWSPKETDNNYNKHIEELKKQ